MTTSTKKFHYPPAREADIVDDFHGTAVPDPYRWLEDADTAETMSWVAAQNELTHSFLAELTVREQIEDRLTALWDYPKMDVPFRRGNTYFCNKNSGLQDQPVLYKQPGLTAEPTVLLDPNSLSDDGTVAVIQHSPTTDGRLLAYSQASSGSDWQEIHVVDVDTGVTLPDQIKWAKFTNIAWMPDNSGFFYARYPAPEEMPTAPPSTHHRVYFHQLGTEQAADRLVYARPDAPNLGFNPIVTEDGRYLLLHVWDGTDRRNRVYLRPLNSDEPFTKLLDDFDAKYQFISNDGDLFYFHTDLAAPKGRIIAIDLNRPARTEWQEIIREQADSLEFALTVHDHLVVGWLHHAHHTIMLYKMDGTAVKRLQLPTIGTVVDLSGKRDQTELFINFQSFLYPPTILRYDFNSEQLTTLHQANVNFDPDAYETHQYFCPSKDGTLVPIFLTQKKGLEPDGNTPTLLYGYGGFTVNLLPSFNPTRLIWLEMGGIYVQANLRGGNEYGEEWHRAGMMENKQNVFDDFIGVAEWLVEKGYTQPKKLAIQGGSNGGLLVAVSLLQRPELFGAVHCAVPVIDMLRYHKFTAGRYWTSEYGNAEADSEAFTFMYRYSPLHNVKPGVCYPPVLITSADTDDRVVPMHAKKFAAMLQAKDAGINPILLRVETKAGHGLGKPTTKLIAEAVDVYAFLWTLLARNS